MFKRKNKENIIDSFEEDMMDISSKEDEIMSSYIDDYVSGNLDDEEYELEDSIEEEENSEIEEAPTTEDYEYEYSEDLSFDDGEYQEYQEDYENDSFEEKEEHYKKDRNYKKLINVVFALIIVFLIMITVDVISVARYDVGPFFAIPLEKYKDGGSKAYFGLGYKVIKYNQLQGRRDKEIGFWNLKYNVEPVDIKDIDLAIEMYNKEIKTYKKYYKKFIRITSTLEKVNKDKNTITLAYKDEGKKYTLEINCNMASKKSVLDSFEVGKEITVIGSVSNFKYKSKTSPNKLYINNCFAEQ